MDTPRVLVVDDDAAIRRSLERGLRLGGFAVTLAVDARTAKAALAGNPVAADHAGRAEPPPDVLVLDVCLPDESGAAVCRALRAAGDDIPVLMLSALDELEDRVAGLQAGADDYLVKPFALSELTLRLRALLRRSGRTADAADASAANAAEGESLRLGPLALRPAAREATCDGAPLTLTRREFDLLEHLTRNAGLVLSRGQLLDAVWGYEMDVRTDVVDTFVSYLRRKLEADGRPRLIHTVRGVGFVLREPKAERYGEPGNPGGPRP
ncbi:DNA-binding response regulator [Mangrovactinospora gilvigrisea]|uniref:DNA-binding response regulator n=1 Tax=Mangrovactinospora gilvigrisea TaxID=1428644 RepID=A0A1J7BI37_9ACTN|nr:response regulator transcription factor [Mangrovactinospora gilvigrisea]OIV38245.1 DNA-binding response regulator [Mangrovactinospora gilvigrisea]